MKNIDVIKNFIKGATKGKSTNLRIEGDKLFNYDTCIAQRWEKIGGEEFGFVANVTKYSQSTTTIQNQLLKLLIGHEDTRCINHVPMGADSLIAED